MKINGTFPPSFSEGSKEPSLLKKIVTLIASIAAAALSYFVAGWIGLVVCAASLTAIHLYSKAQPAPLQMTLNPQGAAIPFTHANKAYAYRLLTEGRGLLEDRITLEKVHVSPTFTKMESILLTQNEGPFSYPAGTHHWTANFGDQNVFFGSISGLLAQDELQALEHPALSHVYMKIKDDPTFGKLDLNGSALLVEGAKRYGILHNIYGNQFATSTLPEIEQNLERLPNPRESKLFVMIAPHIPAHLEGQPYQYNDLRALFYNAYAAFKAIATKDSEAVIHTGNWGCGAFGNDPKTVALIQLAAARFAGVHELSYYPLGSASALNEAKKLLNQIPEMTVENFLQHLTAHAAEYGLFYRSGNGT